jgi:large subunit ribosomal protein L35
MYVFNLSIMHKLKPNSGASKRFKVTGTGKIKRKHAFKRHILTKKATDRKRRLSSASLVSDADVERVRTLLAI